VRESEGKVKGERGGKGEKGEGEVASWMSGVGRPWPKWVFGDFQRVRW